MSSTQYDEIVLNIGDKISIGESVLRILGKNTGQIRIGIEAPRHIPVHREEVYHRIKEKEKRK